MRRQTWRAIRPARKAKHSEQGLVDAAAGLGVGVLVRRPTWEALRLLVAAAGVAAAYSIGVRLALAVRLPGSSFSPIWPPIAVMLAVLLLTPARRWWIWLLAAASAHLAIYLPLGRPLWQQAIQLAHNLLIVLLPAIVLRRYGPEAVQLTTVRGVLVFLGTVAGAGLLMPLGSAAIYVATGMAGSFWLIWQLIAFSNTLAYLTILPAVLLLARYDLSRLQQMTVPRLIEVGISTALVLLVSRLVFGVMSAGPDSDMYIAMSTLPLLLWIAVRFGLGGVSLAVTTMTLAAIAYASQGVGPFTGATPTRNVLQVPSYFLTFVAPAMLLAALMAERRHSEAALVQLAAELEERVTTRTVELARANASLAVARDQAEAASQAKSDFLATMSHELRTPLHTILGYNRLVLSAAALPPEQRAHALVVQRGAEHLLTLINNVLDLSKIEAGQSPLHATSVNLTKLLTGLTEMFRLQAEQKGLRLRCLAAATIPRYVVVDIVKLRQVLINLLGNALKFTQAGSVTLTASCELRDGLAGAADEGDTPPEALLIFEVADTGPGLTPDEQQQIFDAFVQTHTGRRTGEGTGLGLTICRQFVRLMGGGLSVRSTVGHGTVFEVSIPVQLTPAGSAAHEEPREGPLRLAPAQQAYRVLVVENHDDNRLLLITLLRSLGLNVRGARDGEEAIATWLVWQPHLIFLGLRLPRRNGLDVARDIRETAHGFPPAIVAVSASAFETDRAAALAAGCNGFIRKPFQDSEIIDALRQHLGVRFTAADDEPQAPPPLAPAEALDQTALAALPDELLAMLASVSIEGNPRQIATAIAKVKLHAPALVAPLQALADQVAFDVILESVRAAQKARGSYDPA